MQRWLVLTSTLLALVSACSKPQGGEGGPCYPNATCDEGLTCLSETCVDIGGGREGEGEGEGEPAPLAGVLANSQPFLASNDCPTGGVDVSTGIDVNANGVLEAAEVTRVVTICNGADGASALVAQEALPGGETCGAGGVRVRSGIDADRDGILDENEVLRSDDVCNGAAGAPGATTRVVLSEVGAGERCSAGGIHFTAGLDVDGDGSLSAGEVQQEAIVCNGPPGEPGAPGTSCTVTRDEVAGTTTVACEDGTSAVIADGTDCTTTRDDVAGTSTIRCDDGTVATVRDGATGAAGTSCTVSRDSNAGTTTIRCADGTAAVIPDGRNGADGTSCTVSRDDVAGTTAIVCEDGTSAVIADGTDCTTTRDDVAATSTIRCEDGTTAVVRDGATGERGASCTVNRDSNAGTTTVRCEDGTTAVIPDGGNGADGTSCTVVRNDPVGITTVSCEDGTSAVIQDGTDCTTARDDASATTTVRCGDGTTAVVRDGVAGADGSNCSVTRDAVAGTTTVSCSDGTSAVIPDGRNGADGTSCTVLRNELGGTTTVSCEDGTSAIILDGTDCTTTRNEQTATTTILCGDGTTAVVRDGATGASGRSCTVSRDDATGRTTVSCQDGTSAVIPDGNDCTATRNEAAGTTTIACQDGSSATITDGVDGADGTSCTVTRDNTAGTSTITCEDGTSAVVRDGAQGTSGLQSLIRLEPELGGPRCPFSGTRILVGVDDNRNAVLEGTFPGNLEVDQVSVVCSTEPGECAAGFNRAATGACVLECSARNFVSGQFGEVADSPLLNLDNADFTIELWIHRSDATGIAYFLGHDEGQGGSSRKWILGHGGIPDTPDAIWFHVNDPGVSSPMFFRKTVRLTPGAWNHIAVVRQGTDLRLFINGRLSGRDTITIPILDPAGPLTISQAEDDGFVAAAFSEARISRVARRGGCDPDQTTILTSARWASA
jgi:hypothetical protein